MRRLFTWNTQGDFTDAAKQAIIQGLLLRDHCVGGFLQEGGSGKAGTAIPGSTVYSGEPVGALNARCTNYVILSDAYAAGSADVVFFDAIGGGVAGRTAAAVRVGDVTFVSWHSLAGRGNADTSALIEECASRLRHDQVVVIGGDFNASPDDVNDIIGRKAGRKQFALAAAATVQKSGKWTHEGSRGRRELDFFVVLGGDSGLNCDVWVKYVTPSDHNPVLIDIPI